MRKQLLLALLLVLGVKFTSHAQDTIRIKHTNYITVFSKSLHYPVLVEWWETKAKDGCPTPLPRKDQFAPDPLQPELTNIVKDYVGSGTDRGHMCPAASNECNGAQVLTECFYMSNMAPQYHALNAGDWKSLETLTRDLAIKNDSIHVWAGSVGVAKTIGEHKVAVPKECWKVIYIVKTKEWFAYEFTNTTDKPTGLHSHQVTVADIEKLTGFKFGGPK
jgi:endonuclease G, mitochondrial